MINYKIGTDLNIVLSIYDNNNLVNLNHVSGLTIKFYNYFKQNELKEIIAQVNEYDINLFYSGNIALTGNINDNLGFWRINATYNVADVKYNYDFEMIEFVYNLDNETNTNIVLSGIIKDGALTNEINIIEQNIQPITTDVNGVMNINVPDTLNMSASNIMSFKLNESKLLFGDTVSNNLYDNVENKLIELKNNICTISGTTIVNKLKSNSYLQAQKVSLTNASDVDSNGSVWYGLTDRVYSGVDLNGYHGINFNVSTGNAVRVLYNGSVGVGCIPAYLFDVNGNANINGSLKVSNDTATATISNVGAIRYRTSGNNSYCEMSMQTATNAYSWVIIKQNSW